jgi:hypothetical protein
LEGPLPTLLPRETVRNGAGARPGASTSLTFGSEIELRGPISSTFEALVRGLLGLFGQFLEEAFSETHIQLVASLSNRTGAKRGFESDRLRMQPQDVVVSDKYAGSSRVVTTIAPVQRDLEPPL